MTTSDSIAYLARYQEWRRGSDRTFDQAGFDAAVLSTALDTVIAAHETLRTDQARIVALGVSSDNQALLGARADILRLEAACRQMDYALAQCPQASTSATALWSAYQAEKKGAAA